MSPSEATSRGLVGPVRPHIGKKPGKSSFEELAPQLASTPPATDGTQVKTYHAEDCPVECAICLDPLTSGVVCALPCSHTFHATKG